MPAMVVISVSQTFPAVDRCIYCGKGPPEVTLTLEHIIPRGLKGYLKLPNGSCTGCASITKKFEQDVLRKMLGDVRIHSGLGWGEKDRQPTQHNIGIKTETGHEYIEVPTGDHPGALAMLDFPPPRILRGLPPGGTHEKVRVTITALNDIQERVDKVGKGREVRIEQIGGGPSFLRMLAKIGHGYASALKQETGEFEPLLLDMILKGDVQNASDLIGGADEHMPSSEAGPDHLHDIRLMRAMRRDQPGGQSLLVACIQLFRCVNMPVYQVVVGRRP